MLLSSLPGAAIVNVKIEGVEHEFSTIEGVVEDVMGIILNLKKVVFKVASEDPRFEQKLELTFMGEGTVTAENFDNVDGVEIINKDQVIAHLSSKGKLMLEVTVRRGVGYVNADTNKSFSRNEKGLLQLIQFMHLLLGYHITLKKLEVIWTNLTLIYQPMEQWIQKKDLRWLQKC